MLIIVLQTIDGKRYIRKAIHAFTPAFIFTKNAPDKYCVSAIK